MSNRDPKEQDQKADKRQGGNVETKGASKAPPSGDRAEKHSADEGQPSTGGAEEKR